MKFTPASRKEVKLRLAIVGPAGSGKTYSALSIATNLGKRVALVDTENGSADLYASKQFQFDRAKIDAPYHPEIVTEAIKSAHEAGYDVLIVDSLSHFWMGEGGVLNLVDQANKRMASGGSLQAWKEIGPRQQKMVEAILHSPLHILCTMRTKNEFLIEPGPTGKTKVTKVGLAPVQRDSVEYEFDIYATMTDTHDMIITKTRCSPLTDAVFNKPGKDVADILLRWIDEGDATPATQPDVKFEPTQPEQKPEPPSTPNVTPTRAKKKPEPPKDAPKEEPPSNGRTVAYLIESIPRVLKKYGASPLEEAVEYAEFLVCKKWELGKVGELDNDKYEELKVFLRQEVIPDLTERGYINAA